MKQRLVSICFHGETTKICVEEHLDHYLHQGWFIETITPLTGGDRFGWALVLLTHAEEAIEKAWYYAHVSLCHECSAECENVDIEELEAEEIVGSNSGC